MDVMLDIETMGTGQDAAIVTIGAVKFDRHGIGDEFYVAVDLEDASKRGGTMSASTVIWWMQQSEIARKHIYSGDRENILNALLKLSMFMDGCGDVWACGSGFDNAIIRSAYDRAGIECPFPFWKDRCYRTIRSMHPDIECVRIGTHHNALDDARTQAEHLISIIQARY